MSPSDIGDWNEFVRLCIRGTSPQARETASSYQHIILTAVGTTRAFHQLLAPEQQ